MTEPDSNCIFDLALEALWIAFRPIVDWKKQELFGYEALVRSREPRLSSPGLLLDAAERLGRLDNLGRKIRQLVAAHMNATAGGGLAFVNLHPRSLLDSSLFDPSAPHRFAHPDAPLPEVNGQ